MVTLKTHSSLLSLLIALSCRKLFIFADEKALIRFAPLYVSCCRIPDIHSRTFQPDIFEDDEFELDDMAFGAGVKLEHADEKSIRDGVEDADKHERRERRLVWLWVCGFIFGWHRNIS
jgi:hypothetical protein